jgi:hypothetical protein
MATRRALIGCLILATLAVLAAPVTAATGGGSCEKAYAVIETSFVPDMGIEGRGIEVGWAAGTFEGSAYLVYDDTAPPIDPALTRPNLVLSSKAGDLRLWVYSDSVADKDGGWYRTFKVLAYEGTGYYLGAKMDLAVYGYCSVVKGGSYELEGEICPAIKPAIGARR